MGLLDKAKALYSKLTAEANTAMNTPQKTNTSASKTTTTTNTSAAGSSASNTNNKVTTTTTTPTATTTKVTTAKTTTTPTKTTATTVTTPSAITTTGTTKSSGQSASNSSSIGSWKTPTYDDDDYYNATTISASQAGSSASNLNNKVTSGTVATDTTSGQSASNSSPITTWKTPTYTDDDYYNATTMSVSKVPASQAGSSASNPNNKVTSGNVSSDQKTEDLYNAVTPNGSSGVNFLAQKILSDDNLTDEQKARKSNIVIAMAKEYGLLPGATATASDLANGLKLKQNADAVKAGTIQAGSLPEAIKLNDQAVMNYILSGVIPGEDSTTEEAEEKAVADKGGTAEEKQTAGAYLGDTTTKDTTATIPTTVDDYAQLIMDIINGGGGTSDVATELSKYGITMPEAVAQAMESLIPSYRKSLQSTLNSLKKTALKGGFYGQLPAEALYQQAVASNESEMQQAIYDLALEIYNSAMDNAVNAQEVANDTAESKVDMLIKLLELQNSTSGSSSSSSNSGIASSTTYDNDGLTTTQIKAIEKGIGLTSQGGKYTDYVKEYAGGLSAKEAYTIYANAPTKTTANYSDSQFTSALLLARQNGNLDSITDWLNENWSKISIKDRKTIQDKLSAATGQKYSVFAD